jgi:hypothetical protein
MKRAYQSVLLDDYPILVLPSLACAIGDRQAMFVQQVHYWLVNKHRMGQPLVFEGREWVYNTQEDWLKQFPFWTKRELQYVIDKAVKTGALIITRPEGTNRRTWYSVNYDFISEIENIDVGVQDHAQLSQDTKLNNGEYGVPMRNSDCTGFVPSYKIVSSNIQICNMNNKESETTTERIILAESRPADDVPHTSPLEAAPEVPEAGVKKARKSKALKPESALFNAVKDAWFALATERETARKRQPHRMVTPADFRNFKASIEALKALASLYDWTEEQAAAYAIEAATAQLDSQYWRDHPMVPYHLKHTVDSLQGWWQKKKKATAEKRAPAPASHPAPAGVPDASHIARVTEENRRRVIEHDQRLQELAAQGAAPLGYTPKRKNPFPPRE